MALGRGGGGGGAAAGNLARLGTSEQRHARTRARRRQQRRRRREGLARHRTTEQQCAHGGAGGVGVRTFFSLQKAAKSPVAFGLRALTSFSFLIFCFASLTLRFSLASLFEPFRSLNFCFAMVFSGPEALPVTWQVVGERHCPHSS